MPHYGNGLRGFWLRRLKLGGFCRVLSWGWQNEWSIPIIGPEVRQQHRQAAKANRHKLSDKVLLAGPRQPLFISDHRKEGFRPPPLRDSNRFCRCRRGPSYRRCSLHSFQCCTCPRPYRMSSAKWSLFRLDRCCSRLSLPSSPPLGHLYWAAASPS